MQQYDYKCVEVPVFAENVARKDHIKAVQAYESLIKQNAADGWELDQIDTITAAQNPGCFRGTKQVPVLYKVLIYRRLLA